ncbi:MAG: hypothetical protein ACLT2Z_06010 [Eubacterium sp.]
MEKVLTFQVKCITKNKLPTFVNPDTIKTPIDSNSWWSSAMVQTFSNLLRSTPLWQASPRLEYYYSRLGRTRTENDLEPIEYGNNERFLYHTGKS